MDALSKIEMRVLGALLEKAITTPDQYPLTLNAIITACNQKSSREPVSNYSQGEVERALRTLEDKLLVSADPNLRGRVEKYQQRFCKPPFGVYDFDNAQYAIITVLMLRGPATPGELRTRTERMHKFADNDSVLTTLHSLRDWKPDGFVVELPREPNRRDCCWAQLFGEDATEYRAGAVPGIERRAEQTERAAAPQPLTASETRSGDGLDRLSALETRVTELEAALARLQDALGD